MTFNHSKVELIKEITYKLRIKKKKYLMFMERKFFLLLQFNVSVGEEGVYEEDFEAIYRN